MTQCFAPDYSTLWRGTGQRCAVDIDEWGLNLPREKVMGLIEKRGFTPLDINMVEIARACVGQSVYKRGALLSEAPAVVDCSSFVWWVYQQRGIELPRFALTQRQATYDIGITRPDELDEVAAGDLIFTKGRISYYLADRADGVGHVGMLTGEGTVIHAANMRLGVVEESIKQFIGRWDRFRGIGRVIRSQQSIITLACPETQPIRWTPDVFRLVLRGLPSE